MSDISQLLDAAVQLQQRGQWQPARELYERILELDPQNGRVLGLLGINACQSRQWQQAVEFLRRAIDVDGSQAILLATLADAHRNLGQFSEAATAYKAALQLNLGAAEVHNNFGILLQQMGRPEEALASYARALRLEPDNVEAQFNRATALEQAGKPYESERWYRRVLELDPAHIRGLNNLAAIFESHAKFPEAQACYERAIQLRPESPDALFHLGDVLAAQNQLDAAIGCYRQALAFRPDWALAQCALGNTLRLRGRASEALDCLERALKMGPDLADTHGNLAAALKDLGRLDEARQCYARAIELAPNREDFQLQLGDVLKRQGQTAAANACFAQALSIRVDNAQAACTRGMNFLSRGHFAAGWAGYEHRVHCPRFDTMIFPQPRWNGMPLDRATLLIHCEQGLGDTLQFIRYVKLVQRRANRVIIAAPTELIPLLAHSGFGPLVSNEGTLPHFDVHAPLMSLPYIFRTEEDTIPCDVPYLAADPMGVAKWHDRLKAFDGLKIGICWQGAKDYRYDRRRSMRLTCFGPLASVPNVRLLSLQKGPGSEQLAALGGAFQVVDLAQQLDNETGAFMDTAAVMMNLDLVITSDTSIAHLAGGLGVRVWVALSASPDWRWLVEREDSPWYPTMRLFRQSLPGQWSEVFERMANELSASLQV